MGHFGDGSFQAIRFTGTENQISNQIIHKNKEKLTLAWVKKKTQNTQKNPNLTQQALDHLKNCSYMSVHMTGYSCDTQYSTEQCS